ncbi:MAG TPA: CBS domain-containing protein, partial [Reyranellaceae bacterium]|nr:CBS domain-containing protein [Reyranellaceae bacterium]
MAVSQVGEPSAHEDFVCNRAESVFTAIERCLDNGTGSCLIVGDDRRLVGRISLDDIRQAVLDGSALADPTLERHLASSADAGYALRNDVTVDEEILRAVVDSQGQLTGVAVDRSNQHVQIARPDMSHHEFRSILDAFISSWISSRGPYVQ